MNKTRLIWGIICLALAALLVVLNLTLPPENLVFMVGATNMPWVPAIILGVIGAILLATAGGQAGATGTPVEAASAEPQVPAEAEKIALNKRLESAGWGLFLIMLGGFAFVPKGVVKSGLWSIGIGLIMLGLNAARYYYKIRMSGFTTVLGILALLGGFAELAGLTNLEGGLLLIILGAYLILKPYFEQNKLFGKAEQSR